MITFENVVGARLIVTDTESLSCFWLCKVRHFPGLANSGGAIWSLIFQVLHFSVIVFVVSQVSHFQVLQIQRPQTAYTSG